MEDNWATGAIRRLEGARGGGVLYTEDLLGGWSALREGGTLGQEETRRATRASCATSCGTTERGGMGDFWALGARANVEGKGVKFGRQRRPSP